MSTTVPQRLAHQVFSRGGTVGFQIMRLPLLGLPSITIIGPYNIVFADILTILDFNDLEMNFAGVFKAVEGRFRYKDRFVLMNEHLFVANGNLCRSSHNHPVL